MNPSDIIEKLKDLVEDIEDYYKDEWKLYDDTIDYNNEPNLYDQCPHCNSKEYDMINEVLEDAVMKVKCKICQLCYYQDWGK